MKIMEQRKKKSHHIRNLMGIALIMTAILSIFSTVLYQSVKGVLGRQLGITAQSAARATALNIMGDLGSYKAQVASGSSNTEYYHKMQQYMQDVATGGSVKYLFAETRVSPDTSAYVLGSEPAGSPRFIKPGVTAPNDNPRSYVYATREPYSSDLLVDPDGRQWVVAYAPILDTDGSALGLVGAEVDTSSLLVAIYDQFGVVAIVCIGVFSVLITFATQVSPHIVAAFVRDELTGAYNKRYLSWFLSSRIKKSKRSGAALSVLMVELDQLDVIHGKFGQEFGDLVLKYFSMRVMNTLRQGDRYARVGDGVFVVVLPDTSVGMAARVGERIRRIAENNKIHHISVQQGVIATISAGAAGLTLHVDSAEKLLQDAESSLAAAKERRNAVAMLQQGILTVSDSQSK